MSNHVPFALPSLTDQEAQAARRAILSGWVTQGPEVKAFEEAFGAYCGARYACAVSSCTAALHLALRAVGVAPGDVVVTVSHSFIATSNAIRYCGAEPVFVDIDAQTLNMAPGALAHCLEQEFAASDGALWYRNAARIAVGESPLAGRTGRTGRLAAVLVVHQVGMPADLGSLMSTAASYGIPVVEDAACAVGSEWRAPNGEWERIGRPRGELACFSFHPRKIITTGDGGMITTNSPEHDRFLRLARQHGMGVSDLARHGSDRVIFEEYMLTGYNYRMTDIQAAVGATQLQRLPDLLADRQRVASAYGERLASVEGVAGPQVPPYARMNWQSYVVRLDPKVNQLAVMQRLKDRGISTRRGVMCAHLEQPYRGAWTQGAFPTSEDAQRQCIMLPFFPGMSENTVDTVVKELTAAVKNHRKFG